MLIIQIPKEDVSSYSKMLCEGKPHTDFPPRVHLHSLSRKTAHPGKPTLVVSGPDNPCDFQLLDLGELPHVLNHEEALKSFLSLR